MNKNVIYLFIYFFKAFRCFAKAIDHVLEALLKLLGYCFYVLKCEPGDFSFDPQDWHPEIKDTESVHDKIMHWPLSRKKKTQSTAYHIYIYQKPLRRVEKGYKRYIKVVRRSKREVRRSEDEKRLLLQDHVYNSATNHEVDREKWMLKLMDTGHEGDILHQMNEAEERVYCSFDI